MNIIHYRREPLEPQPSDEPKRGRPRIYDDEQRVLQHRIAVKKYNEKMKVRREPCFFAVAGEAARAKLCTDISTELPEVMHSNSLAIIGEC